MINFGGERAAGCPGGLLGPRDNFQHRKNGIFAEFSIIMQLPSFSISSQYNPHFAAGKSTSIFSAGH
jgi:hypothetical protein